ncbi:MAG: putative DNA-binding domain-containing protein [Acidithiobacillales bacterium]
MNDLAPLRRLQRFVQAVVVHPGETRRAASAAARRELAGASPESALLPSRRLTGVERLGIYQGMYLLRMRDALAGDYPGLARALGDGLFSEFVRAYVQRHPSRSYTLNRLGDDVPSYLARTRRFPHGRFLADLARLELAVTEVFDAEAPAAVRRIRPARVGERTTFRPSPTLRFLSFRYPVGSYLDAVREGRSPAIPRPARTRIAIWRNGTSVRRLDVTPGADALLRRLAAGRALGDALRSLDARQRRDLPKRAIAGLFRTAVSGRMLVPV